VVLLGYSRGQRRRANRRTFYENPDGWHSSPGYRFTNRFSQNRGRGGSLPFTLGLEWTPSHVLAFLQGAAHTLILRPTLLAWAALFAGNLRPAPADGTRAFHSAGQPKYGGGQGTKRECRGLLNGGRAGVVGHSTPQDIVDSQARVGQN